MSIKASTKKETQILNAFKFDCIKLYGHYMDIETMLLPVDDNVNGYIWPDNVYAHGFDYEFGGVRVPSNLSFKICIYFNTGKIVNRRVVLP